MEITAQRPTTEVMVLDSWYCYRVVWSSWSTPTIHYAGDRQGLARKWPLELRRRFARRLAAQLEAGKDVTLPLKRLRRLNGAPYTEPVAALVERFLTT